MRICSLLTATVALATCVLSAGAGELSLQTILNDSGRPTAVELRGLSAEQSARWQQATPRPTVFDVRVADAGENSPAIAGEYEVGENHAIRFTPRFGFEPGMKYVATLRLVDGASKPVRYEFEVKRDEPGEPTRLQAIYPSAAVIPENQLKFYLQFSAPMSRGEVYKHVRLVHEGHGLVDLPFLEIGEELWDPTGTRLTLLIDPGRIKQGVKPREDIGPVFEMGEKYLLQVDRGWKDAAGRPLKDDTMRRFVVGRPATGALDPKTWKIKAVKEGSRDPLLVRFPAPLDRALLERTLWVDRDGDEVAGKASVFGQEDGWTFTPAAAWKAGEYSLVVDTVLEDLAGNRIGSAFEVDALDPLQKRVEAEYVRIPVEIAPAGQ